MSDRLAWLEQCCPECHAAPGARCTRWRSGRGGRSRAAVVPHVHVARGWFGRSCPTCKAAAGERCATPAGREASHVHAADSGPAADWSAPGGLGRARPPGCNRRHRSFSGRAGAGGRTDTIQLLKQDGDELVEIERWTSRDELCHALEAPVWDRLGPSPGIRASPARSFGRVRQVPRHSRQAWRAHVRGVRRVNGPCSPYRRLTVPRQAGLARGPPAGDVLGNEKDRVAAGSSRTWAPAAPTKNLLRAVYPGSGRTPSPGRVCASSRGA